MLINNNNVLKKSVTATIETIEEEDFILNTQLKILFVLSGYLEIMRNGSVILIRMGDIFILNKGELVRVIGSEENATLTVTFLSNDYQEEYPPFILNRPLSRVYKKDAYELIKNCIASLYVELTYQTAGSDYIIEGYAKHLIGLLYRYIRTGEEDKQSMDVNSISDKVKEVVTYINENYADKLSLDKIATRFYSSKYYLAHSFKDQLGISIGNYIKEVRLFHGVRMLETTSEKIVTVALLNGFPNVRSFNETFKKKYNLTPTEYREKRNKEMDYVNEIQSQDVLELLTPYVSIGEISNISHVNPEHIEAQIDLQKSIGRLTKSNYILKVKTDLIERRLPEVNQRLGVEWVSVNRILKKTDIQMKDSQFICSFKELDRILKHIVAAGMTPYFQFQAVDFDDWEEKGIKDPSLFPNVFTQLNYHLQRNYLNSNEWVYEFRCFYEYENSGKLCEPLVEIISLFKCYKNLVIHFPLPPRNAVPLDTPGEGLVYCIDDFTFIRRISLESALIQLFDKKHIEIISENNNFKHQNSIQSKILAFEKDDYLQKYTDLAQANTYTWIFMSLINQEANVRCILPLSLDSEKPFQYFPDELSHKLSLCTPDGRYKENWYAVEFMNRLFEDIIYHDDAYIITKWQENYRILTIYPEEELLIFIDEKNKKDSKSTWKKAKNPLIEVKLSLVNIRGTYRLIKQELTPELIDKRTDIARLKECKILSMEDITYWNGINRPLRTVEEVEIQGDYILEYQVPLFGIVMIDLEKTND